METDQHGTQQRQDPFHGYLLSGRTVKESTA